MTYEEANEYFRYDPDTGEVFWKVDRCGNRGYRVVAAGDLAGSLNVAGYWKIRFKGIGYSRSRLAWLIHTGNWPIKDIDHIDGNKSNDSIHNLRDVTHRENHGNRQCHRNGHLLGSTKDKRRWASRIRVKGVNVHLGNFDTELEAHEAYMIEYNNLNLGEIK